MTLEIRDQLEYDRLKRLSTGISAVRVVPYAGNLVRTDLGANAWGGAKMTFDYSLFHGMWTTEIPFRIWRTYENGVEIIAYSSVNIISLNGTAVIKSGATAGNYSVMQSRNSPRYQPNRGHLYSTALMLPDKQNGVRWWGLGVMNGGSAPYMGIFFKLSGGKLYASLYNLGVEFKTEEITLPDDMQDIDLEKGELFDIQFQWRGVGDFFFFINLRLVHTIKNLGTLDYVSIANPALPSMYLSENVDGTEVEIRVGCVNIDSEGGQNEGLTYTGIVNADDVSVSSKSPPVALLVVYNKLIHKTGINRRDVRLLRMILGTDNASRFQFLRTEDASAFTGLSLIDRYDDSVLQYHDVSLSGAVVVDINKCDTITRGPVSNLMPFVLGNPSDKIDFIINPGDYLIIMGEKKAINALMSATLEFGESI